MHPVTDARRRLEIRPIRAADADALVDFHSRLSPESIYLRYFSSHPQLSTTEVLRFTQVDGTDRLAVVAFGGEPMVGVARADRFPGTTRAEVAVIVADDHQHLGVGTALLERLVGDALAVGIEVFEADALMTNHRMLSVFHRLGLPVSSHTEGGVTHVTIVLAPDATYEQACATRRRTFPFGAGPEVGA